MSLPPDSQYSDRQDIEYLEGVINGIRGLDHRSPEDETGDAAVQGSLLDALTAVSEAWQAADAAISRYWTEAEEPGTAPTARQLAAFAASHLCPRRMLDDAVERWKSLTLPENSITPSKDILFSGGTAFLAAASEIIAAHPEAAGSPLIPLMLAYSQHAPQLVEAHTHPRPLMPTRVAHARAKDNRSKSQRDGLPLFTPASHPQTQKRDAVMLPGFGFPSSVEPPVALPLAIYKMGAGPENQRGRGAPLALRLFIESLMATPPGNRERGQPAVLHLPVAQVRHWLYPKSPPARGVMWRRLWAAIHELDAAWIPVWAEETRQPELRRVVMISGMPPSPDAADALDAKVRIVVDLPASSHTGPSVDRARLRQLGVEDAAAYRLYIGLSYHLYEPGRSIRPAGRQPGRTGQHWTQSRNPRDYTPLTDYELSALAYPLAQADRSRRQRARAALEKLFAAGDFTDGGRVVGGRFILPPARDE